MSNVVRIKKGLDIQLVGAAEKTLVNAPPAASYAVCPDDFRGFTPKLLVRQNDVVKAGSPLLFDKYRPEVVVTSPVSGCVAAINRGDKRKILEVVVVPDPQIDYQSFEMKSPASASREEIVSLMLAAGMWPMLIQRPYGIIANPADTPRAIFVSGFDSSPLAPDMNFVLNQEADNVEAGLQALAKLTPGKVHLGLNAGEKGALDQVKAAQVTRFSGPHPAGNVGVQIHHVDPVGKGQLVWTMDIQHVAILGRFFRTGKADFSKIIAVTGSEVARPAYYSVISGAAVDTVLKGNIKDQPLMTRVISGNVLTGRRITMDGHFGFYHNQLTVIPEGDHHEFVGWIAPRFKKFSVSHSYFSWICPKKKYDLDTNLNGGERAFVVTGLYEKYLPMDIYPMYLLKAILTGDLTKMENLGIYEVIEEDFALCEFVDPSKTDMQEIIRRGIDQMIRELN